MTEEKNGQPEKKEPKSATVTLKAHGATMVLRAHRKSDQTAETFVTTRDADKKTVRGMTTQHPTFEAAREALEALATKAQKLGWERSAQGRGFAPKPDAFSTLPAPPKAAKK